jgi:hypothetical protein
LGNDLPPRHTHDQTLQNVRLTLENELLFPNVLKIWIINRVVDPAKRAQLEDILRSHGQPNAIIPVNFENEYTTLDIDGGVDNFTHYYGGFLGVEF